MTPRSLPSSPRIHTSAQMTHALVMAGGRETAPPSYGEESVILELTHRLSEQQAEIIAMKNFLERQHHQHQADSAPIGSDAYNTLLAHYMEREEQLRVSKQANGRAIFDLQNERTLNQLKVQDNQEKIAKMEEEVQIQREEVKATDALLKKREVVIDYLQKENADIAAKSKQAIDYLQKENTEVVTKRFLAETAAQKLKDELASYHEMVKKGKTLAEEQIHVLQDNEGAMKDLEDKNDELKEEMEGLKEQLDKTDHTIESKDALLNMQRQQLQEFEDKNLIYEKRFLAKDVDVPKRELLLVCFLLLLNFFCGADIFLLYLLPHCNHFPQSWLVPTKASDCGPRLKSARRSMSPMRFPLASSATRIQVSQPTRRDSRPRWMSSSSALRCTTSS